MGSLLSSDKTLKAYVYGTLESPITAKEIVTIKELINKLHPFSKVLVVDAAVGYNEEIGYIKINKSGIKPGLGANKNLPMIGDCSIIGVVAKKGDSLVNNTVRFSLIYKIAKDIALGIKKLIK